MNAPMRTLAMAIAAAALIPSQAGAASPGSRQHDAISATIRDAAGDVLLSDGNPTYAGRELTSRIVDFTDPATSDRFHFQPAHKRSVRIQTPAIDGGAPVTCEFTFIVFTSSSTPNWYEVITGGTRSSVPTDAFFLCDPDSVGPSGRRFTVAYPDGEQECAVIERLDAMTWRFTAPAYDAESGTGCPARIITAVKERGQETVTEQTGVSAPMEITAVIP